LGVRFRHIHTLFSYFVYLASFADISLWFWTNKRCTWKFYPFALVIRHFLAENCC